MSACSVPLVIEGLAVMVLVMAAVYLAVLISEGGGRR